MNRRVLIAAICSLVLTPIVNAEEFAPKILKYFPGKWEIKDADGVVKGTADWKVVAGGKAVAGAGTSVDHGDTYALAGWNPSTKKWIHNWFQKDGSHGHLEVTKCEGDTYFGQVTRVTPEGKTTKAEWQNKVVDQNHFEVTESLDGESTVIYWHRIRD